MNGTPGVLACVGPQMTDFFWIGIIKEFQVDDTELVIIRGISILLFNILSFQLCILCSRLS